MIVEEEGLSQIRDTGQLEAWVDEVIAGAPAEVERYRQGNHVDGAAGKRNGSISAQPYRQRACQNIDAVAGQCQASAQGAPIRREPRFALHHNGCAASAGLIAYREGSAGGLESDTAGRKLSAYVDRVGVHRIGAAAQV